MARILFLLFIALSSLSLHNCGNLLETIFDDGHFVVETIERNINEFASVPESKFFFIFSLFRARNTLESSSSIRTFFVLKLRFSVVDTLLQDLVTDYGLTLSSDESDFTLQNELVKFLLSSEEAQSEVSQFRAIVSTFLPVRNTLNNETASCNIELYTVPLVMESLRYIVTVIIQVLTGFPSEYRAIPRLLRELKVIEKREMVKLNEDDQEVMKAVSF